MRKAADTIAAIATAPGMGAVGLVRLSGPKAFAIAEVLSAAVLPPLRQAGLRKFCDARGQALDSGLLLRFAAPRSFTGEDVVELQGHGGMAVLAEVLAACVAAGARLARPGEFTERAYLNGRLDLAQAEAVADLIEASSAQAVRAAHRTLDGEFSRQVNAAVASLTEARVWVEGALDFSDEDVDWLADARLTTRLAEVEAQLAATLKAASQGARLREGLNVAILGAPNVGKSTLLNALAGFDAAIVSPVAGTTRDLVREHILLDGLTVHIVDTAGLRETDDLVEAEGIRRAIAAAEKAELLLYVVDARSGVTEADRALQHRLPLRPTLLLFNKADLLVTALDSPSEGSLHIAAKTCAGMEELIAAIKAHAGVAVMAEGVFLARARHLEALNAARSHLAGAQAQLQARTQAELAAEELRLAQEALGAITGKFSNDDLLGAIFSRFCIGK